METNANIPSSTEAREYSREGYAVWTVQNVGSSINKNEVVIKGSQCHNTAPTIARMIGTRYKGWVTRAHVRRWEKGQFIAWVNVKDDKLYEFVEIFNDSKRIMNAYASIKREVDAEKKLVIHKVLGKSRDYIAKLVGEEKVRHVEVKGNTAFVTMTSQSYAQAVIGDRHISAEISPYIQRSQDPVKLLTRKFQRTTDTLKQQIAELMKRVRQLEVEISLVAEKKSGKKAAKVLKRTSRLTQPATLTVLDSEIEEEDATMETEVVTIVPCEGSPHNLDRDMTASGERNDVIMLEESGEIVPHQETVLILNNNVDNQSQPQSVSEPSDEHTMEERKKLLISARRAKRRERALSDSQALIYNYAVLREDTPRKESGKRGTNTMLSENSRKKALLKTPDRMAQMKDLVQASKEVASTIVNVHTTRNEVNQPQLEQTPPC